MSYSQTQPPPGWYPDPATSGQERYWDGMAWTNQVRLVPQQAMPQQAWQQSWGQTPAGYQLQPSFVAATADGVPLAGWWSRAGALIIDNLVMFAVVGIVTIPFASQLTAGFTMWFDDLLAYSSAGGTSVPDYTDPRYGIVGPYMAIALISLVLQLGYTVSMQTAKGATLGMLALGLRVVPTGRGREHNGLSFGTSLGRNVAYILISAIIVFDLVNVLLPLMNQRRQTLHDMLAKTQVVRIR